MVLYELKTVQDTIELRVLPGAVLSEPIIINSSYAMLTICVEGAATVTIIDRGYAENQNVNVIVSPYATVAYYIDKAIPAHRHYKRTLFSVLEPHARLAIMSTFSCAGDFSLECSAFLDGEYAQFFAGATVTVEPHGVFLHNVVQRHVGREGQSESALYGIVESHGTFHSNGLITVQPNAHGTCAQHLTKALTLGKDACVRAKPMLKVAPKGAFVKHGAAIGPLDKALLLFLQSRGIEPERGKALLKTSFFTQMRVKVPDWLNKCA